MDGSFACPECGCEIRLTGLSPGREVRCDWCRSVVEVPFLPRADQIKRARRYRRRRRWPAWAWGTVCVLCAAILIAGTNRFVRSHRHSAVADTLTRLVETSREAEKCGRLGEALATIEAALTLAGKSDAKTIDCDGLRRLRHTLARREAESQLSGLESLPPGDDPGRAVGRALTLAARVRNDEALAGLEEPVNVVLERLRLRWVEADSLASKTAFEAGKPDKALDLCQRAHTTADELPRALREKWQADATDLARKIIARHGTIIDPVRGHFSGGTPRAYAATLHPPLTTSLRLSGYLPRPPSPLWNDLWTSLAPYRVTVEINEKYEDTYLQSANRLSVLDGTLSLLRDGKRFWYESPTARTQVPLPGLPAYQASRVAVGDHRSPEFERLLYENARNLLAERLVANLRSLPACAASATSTASDTPFSNDPIPRFQSPVR